MSKIIWILPFFSLKNIKSGLQLILKTLFVYCHFWSTLFIKIGPKCQTLILNWALICQRPFSKKMLNFHSINPGFDAEVTEKSSIVIYYWTNTYNIFCMCTSKQATEIFSFTVHLWISLLNAHQSIGWDFFITAILHLQWLIKMKWS